MCGRFTLTTTWEDLKAAYPEFEFVFQDNLPSPVSYNIAPTHKVIVASAFKPQPVEYFHWGLIPSWAKDDTFAGKLINARSETLLSKPSFKAAARNRRCLVFTNGFFEWKKEKASKQPYFIRMKQGQIFTFGGIWESWRQPDGNYRNTVSIITTKANDMMLELHQRMPLIIQKNQFQDWLDHQHKTSSEIEKMLEAYSGDDLEYYAVDSKVNHVKNNDPSCIQRIGRTAERSAAQLF